MPYLNYLVYLFYPILLGILLWGAKFCRKGSWNDEFISLGQTKAFQGFCALCIMFHHLGQKTCASWLPEKYIVHGLDFFVPIGYLLVGVFLFFSGFGLYKSYKTKPNYLHKFKRRRIYPPIFFGAIAGFAFIVMRIHREAGYVFPNPFSIGGMQLNNEYAWYIYASVLFYMAFYLSFKYIKKEKIALGVTCAVVVLYIVFCEWWMYGEWWYNTAPMFLVGIFFARNEEYLTGAMKRHYAPSLIISTVIFAGYFALGQLMQSILPNVQTDFQYHAARIIFTTSQMVAAVGFMAVMLLLGLKIKIGNKALKTMGTMTLEFYLIHGLFVQLFGYRFVTEEAKPLIYIRNVALYTLVVFACSIASVILMKLADRFVQWFVKKYDFVARKMRRDSKIAAVAVLVVLAFVFIPVLIRGRLEVSEYMPVGDQYQEEFNVFADVDGEKMSAYIAENKDGNNEHTVVILRNVDDPCISITLRGLSEQLAEQGLKVIVLDGLGSGFSDDTERERTADNIVYEIRTALQNLGEKGPYVLMPIGSSGIYAQAYIDSYRSEVEGMIAIETEVAQQIDKILEYSKISFPQYKRAYYKQIFLSEIAQKLDRITGVYEMKWGIYERNYMYLVDKYDEFGNYDEFLPLKSRYYEKYHNKNSMDEMRCTLENYERVADLKYPEDLPVLTMISYAKSEARSMEFLKWREIHEDLMTNEDIQEIRVVTGGPQFIYHLNYSNRYISKTIDSFIERCVEGDEAAQ